MLTKKKFITNNHILFKKKKMYISYEPYISVWNFTQYGGLSNLSKGSSYVYVSLR